MNPFINKAELRPRAWIRLPVYFFFSFLLLTVANSLPLAGFEYIISALVSLSFFWLMFRFTDNRVNLKEAGLEQNICWWQEFFVGTLFAAIVMGIIFIVQLVTGDVTIISFGWESVGHSFWLIPVLFYFIKMLSVGFYEELITRSYLLINIKEGVTFKNITPARATLIGVLISSSIFGFLHAMNPNATLPALVNIGAAGIMLALPFVLTGRLSYSIGIHFAWNFFQGGVFGFKVSGVPVRNSIINIKQSGNPIWTGGEFGPEGGLMGLLGILLIVVLLLIYIKKIEGKLEFHPMFKRTYLENQESLRKADELA